MKKSRCFRCGGDIASKKDMVLYFGREGLYIHKMCGAEMNYGKLVYNS